MLRSIIEQAQTPSTLKAKVGQLSGTLLSYELSKLHTLDRPVVIITPDMQTAQRIEDELKFFDEDLHCVDFPHRETLPYDHVKTHQDIISARLKVLNGLSSLSSGYLITPCHTLLDRLPPESYIHGHSVQLSVNQTIDLNHLKSQLIGAGYRVVDQVNTKGDLALRGSVFDIYPMGAQNPYRVDLFDDEIDSIRTFDPATQLSTGTLDAINILPAYEYPTDIKALSHFEMQWQDYFGAERLANPIIQGIRKQTTLDGLEAYLPLFFES